MIAHSGMEVWKFNFQDTRDTELWCNLRSAAKLQQCRWKQRKLLLEHRRLRYEETFHPTFAKSTMAQNFNLPSKAASAPAAKTVSQQRRMLHQRRLRSQPKQLHLNLDVIKIIGYYYNSKNNWRFLFLRKKFNRYFVPYLETRHFSWIILSISRSKHQSAQRIIHNWKK